MTVALLPTPFGAVPLESYQKLKNHSLCKSFKAICSWSCLGRKSFPSFCFSVLQEKIMISDSQRYLNIVYYHSLGLLLALVSLFEKQRLNFPNTAVISEVESPERLKTTATMSCPGRQWSHSLGVLKKYVDGVLRT